MYVYIYIYMNIYMLNIHTSMLKVTTELSTPVNKSWTLPCIGWSLHLTTAPRTYATDVELGLYVGPLTTRTGTVSDSVACLWIPFPWLGCLVWLQWKRMHLVLLCQGGLVPMGWDLPFSEEKENQSEGEV